MRTPIWWPARPIPSPPSAAASAPRRARTPAAAAVSMRPVAIRALKRYVTEQYGVESMKPDTQDRLRERGHRVKATVTPDICRCPTH